MPQTESSGPDLDAEGDADYLNFFAQIEGILPTSFFSAEDGKPFDQSSIDIPGHLDGLKRLQERSRDLRLVAVEARLAVLNRDIAGFTAAVSTIAEWLENSWDTVHPGAQDVRQSTVGTLDLPTVVFPLQYSPLFEARRIGAVTFRRWLIATGEVKPREGEAEQSASAITQAIAEADTAVLAAAQAQIVRLDDALNRIRNTFAAHGSSVDLPNLAALLGKMRAFIGCGAPTSDTSPAADGDASPDGMRETPVLADACPPPASLADAASALGVIADYYSRREPSSPILPLVRQARELVGKSFVEVMAVLMPSQVDKAAFRIGTDQVFELPVGRLSSFSAVAPDESSTVVSDAPIDAAPADEHPRPRYSVDSRAKAIALLDAVQRYFRIAEPSSPVPMLCERARGLAERDFMSVLRDVLPKAALRNVNADD
jgi:type VI secretion system protein ImpA